MIILGAGMSGCLAGVLNPQAVIYEGQENPPINHNAVLRFRSNAVSKATGIPFKQVTVRKGIYLNGEFIKPDIEIANIYSMKVINKINDRSIWNLEPAIRYIAPNNFQELLFNLVKHRVMLDNPIEDVNDILSAQGTISTIPLPTLLKILHLKSDIKFQHQSIVTYRYKIKNCDVHQTIYFPGIDTPVYRATLTGDNLILEAIDDEDIVLTYILGIFGIHHRDIEPIVERKLQTHGKIAEIDNNERRKLLYKITNKYGIYSAGRFAIWKNILMDDVLNDLHVIKEMQVKDEYEHHRRL